MPHPNSKEARSLERSQRLMREVLAVAGRLDDAKRLLGSGQAFDAFYAAREASDKLGDLAVYGYTASEIALAVAMVENLP